MQMFLLSYTYVYKNYTQEMSVKALKIIKGELYYFVTWYSGIHKKDMNGFFSKTEIEECEKLGIIKDLKYMSENDNNILMLKEIKKNIRKSK